MTDSIETLVERLACAEHCRYYKPWNTPEPDCEAAERLRILMESHAGVLSALERMRDSRISSPLRKDALLLRRVCTRCEHYPYNCAYRKPDRTSPGRPCGALLVLDFLLNGQHVRPEKLVGPHRRQQRNST